MITLRSLDPEDWTDYKISREPGETEHWRIRNFTIPEASVERMRNIREGRDTGSGDFVALDFRTTHERYADDAEKYFDRKQDWRIMMSDTRAEIIEHLEFMDRVATHLEWSDDPCEVLITGLGLGMVAEACANMGANVTVIDTDAEVISLVAWQLPSNVRVIEADAFTWKPDRQFDLAWHDIWPTISPDNLAGMRQLKRHYRRYVNAWQGCWAWERCLHMQRVLRTDPFRLNEQERRHRALLGDADPDEVAATFDFLTLQQIALNSVNQLREQGLDAEADEAQERLSEHLRDHIAQRDKRKELVARRAALKESLNA